MRKQRGHVLVVLGVVLILALSARPSVLRAVGMQGQPVSLHGIFLQSGSPLKVFALTAPQPPAGWTSAHFQDAAWLPASPIWSDVQSCVSQYVPGWPQAPGYWGQNADATYLFRQSFTLPRARSYADAILNFGAASGPQITIYLNGRPVTQRYGSFSGDAPVGDYLHSGTNVLAVSATPATLEMDNNTSPYTPKPRCSALAFSLRIGLSAPQLLIPVASAVTSEASVPFGWAPFAGASLYDLQIWLVRPSTGQDTAGSTISLATSVNGLHYDLNTQKMPRGTYAWRLAAATAQGALISAWTPESTFRLQ